MASKHPKRKIKKYHKRRGHFLSFRYCPQNLRFENQDEKEKVVLMLRKHILTNLGWILMVSIGLVIPYIIEPLKLIEKLPDGYQVIAVASWYLVIFGYSLHKFIQWYFSVNIITDERIMDFDFHHITYKEVSDTSINRVQDVSYKVSGVIRTFFNFGDVLIQTAGEEPNFEFIAVPDPEQVVDILQELQTEEEIEKLEGRIR